MQEIVDAIDDSESLEDEEQAYHTRDIVDISELSITSFLDSPSTVLDPLCVMTRTTDCASVEPPRRPKHTLSNRATHSSNTPYHASGPPRDSERSQKRRSTRLLPFSQHLEDDQPTERTQLDESYSKEALESGLLSPSVPLESYQGLTGWEVVTNTSTSRNIWDRLWVVSAIVLCVFVVITAICVLSIGSPQTGQTNPVFSTTNSDKETLPLSVFSTGEPTASPITNPPIGSSEALQHHGLDAMLVRYAPESAMIANTDGQSPQAKALRWLRGNTYTETDSTQRILQRYALAVFYYSTNGEQWQDNSGWLGHDTSECDWFQTVSTSCDSIGQLVALDLSSNRLSGTLASELSLLSSSLRKLILPHNFLWGTLPRELSSLSKLTVFNVGSNPISGVMPNDFGALTELEEFSVFNTKVHGRIPISISSWLEMDRLFLGKTNLSGKVPDSLCPTDLWADCADVDCPCCTHCCDSGICSKIDKSHQP